MERRNCDDKAYFSITNDLLSFVHVVTPSWHRREVLQICGFVKIQLNPQEAGGEGAGIPGNSWWGRAARFSKSWPHFRPKYVIFYTRFQTWPLKCILVFRPAILEIMVSLLRLKDQQRYFLKAILNSCIFSFRIETTNIYIFMLYRTWKIIPDSRPKWAECMARNFTRNCTPGWS